MLTVGNLLAEIRHLAHQHQKARGWDLQSPVLIYQGSQAHPYSHLRDRVTMRKRAAQ